MGMEITRNTALVLRRLLGKRAISILVLDLSSSKRMEI